MSIPSRPLSASKYGQTRTFFASARTWGGRSIFQTERMANLLIDVLRSQMRTRRFVVHDFVVMPDHVHILLTVNDEMTLGKAMQLVKGGFSYRAGKELDYRGEIWQRGFSDVLALGGQGFCG